MAAFISRDKVENVLGKSVSDMDNNDLVGYFKAQQKLINGVRMSMVTADYVIAEKFLIEQYGQPDAGRIVKWLFYRYAGKVVVNGEPDIATLRTFNAKMKWWVDLLNIEQQQMFAAETSEPESYVSADF